MLYPSFYFTYYLVSRVKFIRSLHCFYRCKSLRGIGMYYCYCYSSDFLLLLSKFNVPTDFRFLIDFIWSIVNSLLIYLLIWNSLLTYYYPLYLYLCDPLRMCLGTHYFNTKVLVNHSFQDGMTIPKYSNTTVLQYIRLFGSKVFYHSFTFKIEVHSFKSQHSSTFKIEVRPSKS
jgi:hypothetical protein